VSDAANEAATDASAQNKTHAPRQPKQRGPPEDGIPSTTKVMVANLPYDLSEEKVRSPSTVVDAVRTDLSCAAQGAFRRLRTHLCQDCSSPNSSLHGQETPGAQ